nr:hypothetical protein Iba_chr05aCG16260 [Ipomoea batatas]
MVGTLLGFRSSLLLPFLVSWFIFAGRTKGSSFLLLMAAGLLSETVPPAPEISALSRTLKLRERRSWWSRYLARSRGSVLGCKLDFLEFPNVGEAFSGRRSRPMSLATRFGVLAPPGELLHSEEKSSDLGLHDDGRESQLVLI